MIEGYSALKLKREGGVLTIVLDNPPMNAMTPGMHEELTRIFDDINRDSQTRVVVLTGAGERAFSAGGDIGRMLSGIERGDHAQWIVSMQEAKAIVYGLLRLEKPLVGRINGHAMGLGATLAAFCDFGFMLEEARIADTHVKVGLTAGDGGALIWPLLIGFNTAKRYLMTGEALTGKQAAEIGLIEAAFPTLEALDEAVAARVEALLAGAPMAINTTKMAINLLLRRMLEGVIETHLGLETMTALSEDHHEAAKAFVEKRAPMFTGR